MRIGLALAQYDYSVSGESPLRWETILHYAQLAERVGYDAVWLSDHLLFDVAKYGGPADRVGTFDPVVTLAALARNTGQIRLGTLVLCEAFRSPGVLAKSLASLDRISGGRLDIGIGAGWYEPDYEAMGVAMPLHRERIERLAETLDILGTLLGGEPLHYDGRHHHVAGAIVEPAALQTPAPPLIVGGRGDRVVELAAKVADGWNTGWVWTFDDYRARLELFLRTCEKHGRDPDTLRRSVGLYALCGEDERDLALRFERLVSLSPRGVLDGVTLEQWRVGRLVGTIDEVREQVERWSELGVDELVLSPSAVPFAVTTTDDVELLAAALA